MATVIETRQGTIVKDLIQKLTEITEVESTEASGFDGDTRLITIFKNDPTGWHTSALQFIDYLVREFSLDRREISREEYAQNTVREVADYILTKIQEQQP